MNYSKLLYKVMEPSEDELRQQIITEREKVDSNIDVLYNCLHAIGRRTKEDEYISSKELKGIILDHMARIQK